MSRQSSDPVKRARALANLKPFKKGEAHFGRRGGRGGQLDLSKVPGMAEFVEALGGETPRTMHAALVKLARANSPAAFAYIVQVATRKGFSTKHRLDACAMILDRGFGRAPQFVAIADDRPGLAAPTSAIDGKAYAAEVYRILREAGAVIPGEAPERDERDAGEETLVPAVIEPEAITPIVEARDVTVVEPEPVVEPKLEPTIAAPSLARRGPVASVSGVRRAESQRTSLAWLFDAYRAGNIGGVDMESALYRQTIRATLLLSSAEPDAHAIVEALDRRFRASA